MGLASFNKARRMQELLKKEVSVAPLKPLVNTEIITEVVTEEVIEVISEKPKGGVTIKRKPVSNSILI